MWQKKLKVRTFWELITTFVEVTGEKLVGRPFCSPTPAIQNRVNFFNQEIQISKNGPDFMDNYCVVSTLDLLFLVLNGILYKWMFRWLSSKVLKFVLEIHFWYILFINLRNVYNWAVFYYQIVIIQPFAINAQLGFLWFWIYPSLNFFT